jgi:outer membrane protein OmpA-like peptidoglycan-associated protein
LYRIYQLILVNLALALASSARADDADAQLVFAPISAAVDPALQARLEPLRAALAADPSAQLEISAPVGGRAGRLYFQHLNALRAYGVFEFLATHGAPAERIVLIPSSAAAEPESQRSGRNAKNAVRVALRHGAAAIRGERSLRHSAPPPAGRYEIHFLYDSDGLETLEQARLELAARAIAARSDGAVRLVGHADRRGPATYNIMLSHLRTLVVYAALARAGVDVARITMDWHGNVDAIAPKASDAERQALNRRVDIVVDVDTSQVATTSATPAAGATPESATPEAPAAPAAPATSAEPTAPPTSELGAAPSPAEAVVADAAATAWRWSLALGAAIPQGQLASPLDPGLAVDLGVAKPFARAFDDRALWSATAHVAHEQFRRRASGQTNGLVVWSFVGGARLACGACDLGVRPWLGAGLDLDVWRASASAEGAGSRANAGSDVGWSLDLGVAYPAGRLEPFLDVVERQVFGQFDGHYADLLLGVEGAL